MNPRLARPPERNPTMDMTSREIWTSLHGMALGALFLLAFTGTALALSSLRAEWTTPAGRAATARRLLLGSWTMALLAWATVIVGTFVVYPWYRAAPPKGTPTAQLADYPKARLVSSPKTAGWHEFGMEWKEHVGWLAPIFATAVAVLATQHRATLASNNPLRRAALTLLTAAFLAATLAGLLGALINKAAPLR